MSRKATSPARLTADALRRRIQEWRTTRRRGTAMPEELWTAAGALARRRGIAAVARMLGVDYGTLKRRMATPMKRRLRGTATRPSFVQLPPGPLLMTSPPVGPGVTAPWVEVVNRRGDRLTMSLGTAASERVDMVGLLRALVEGGA
jgi:hypothetical protein